MTSRCRLPLLALALAATACAGSPPVATAPAPAPAPRAAVAAPAAPVEVPAFTGSQPPPAWHLLDLETDGVAGVSARRALRELLGGRQPAREVVVAVIDGGIDTAHAGLRNALWRNPREVPANRRDDDANGYADDVRGWNFIGGADGRNVHHDTYEAARLFALCQRRAPGGDYASLPAADRAECTRAAAYVTRERQEMTQMLATVRQIDQALAAITSTLKTALMTDTLTESLVAGLQPLTPDVARARDAYQQLHRQGITRKEIDQALTDVNNRLTFGLDTAFNPRPIVGDNPTDPAERSYGNADVKGPDASHGTHVAGIIGAVENGAHPTGVAPGVRLMAIRTVPEGDERDKDVANAIRYAADNGAHIINMSFGKGFSPNKAVVDEAVRYADSKGVLLVHAAGNDGANNDTTPSFPTPRYLDGGRPQHWIEVGASSWMGGAALAAPFSNYGATTVDLFAPGVAVQSTVPGGGYEANDGTSMAAPVVSGVAALLMAYFPSLTAADVKRVLLSSAVRWPNQMVTRPGSDARVPFGSLSVTGGIVNAYAAVRAAQAMVDAR